MTNFKPFISKPLYGFPPAEDWGFSLTRRGSLRVGQKGRYPALKNLEQAALALDLAMWDQPITTHLGAMAIQYLDPVAHPPDGLSEIQFVQQPTVGSPGAVPYDIPVYSIVFFFHVPANCWEVEVSLLTGGFMDPDPSLPEEFGIVSCGFSLVGADGSVVIRNTDFQPQFKPHTTQAGYSPTARAVGDWITTRIPVFPVPSGAYTSRPYSVEIRLDQPFIYSSETPWDYSPSFGFFIHSASIRAIRPDAHLGDL
jgi:hypothetical protein